MGLTYIARLIRFIGSPAKIPKKVSQKFKMYKELRDFDQQVCLATQDKMFASYRLSREAGVQRRQALNLGLAEKNELESEHSIFFSSLSLSDTYSIRRILEIGTFDGKNAKLLSELFPQAEIVTYDLADDDSIFLNSYSRGDKAELDRFVSARNAVLGSCPNVIFVQKNSLSLLLESGSKYDLIWVDGAHGYPTVAIDVANSLRLLDPNGLMACDDVWVATEESDAMYKSVATHETLCALKHAKLINFDLITKRLTASHAATTARRKYIAIVSHVK